MEAGNISGPTPDASPIVIASGLLQAATRWREIRCGSTNLAESGLDEVVCRTRT